MPRHGLHDIRQLLEDHLQRLRDDNDTMSAGDPDDAAWHGWEVESNSSSESSESEGWIDVVSDEAEEFDVSDSDCEQPGTVKEKELKTGEPCDTAEPAGRVSTLATTKVDFVLATLGHSF